MARPRTGTLTKRPEWRINPTTGQRVRTYVARYYYDEPDRAGNVVTHRANEPLWTINKAVARKRLDAIVARVNGGTVPTQVRETIPSVETFWDAVVRICQEKASRGIGQAEARPARIENYGIRDAIGHVPLNELTREEIQAALDHAAEVQRPRGRPGHNNKVWSYPSEQQLVHLKNDVGSVINAVRRETDSPIQRDLMLGIMIPASKKEADGLPVEPLTDAEIFIYLSWPGPDPEENAYQHEAHLEHVKERQTMAALSRVIGGTRTGELHDLLWDRVAEDFSWISIQRTKTLRSRKVSKKVSWERHEIPRACQVILRQWWQLNESPTEGYVFPVRKGEREGERRGRMSHAASLRMDLQRAFQWADYIQPGDQRWTMLFEGTSATRRVTFHSFRNAYTEGTFNPLAQELGEDAALQAVARLRGDGQSTTMAKRYLTRPTRVIRTPRGADLDLPALGSGKQARVVPNKVPGRSLNEETRPSGRADLLPKSSESLGFPGDPNEIRTRVAGVRGRCPKPLDDGAGGPGSGGRDR